MTIRDGGLAFPEVKTRKHYVTDIDVHSVGGMSLRDYFAAKAMQGLLADHVARIEGLNLTPVGLIASYSYAIADAMLAERAK